MTSARRTIAVIGFVAAILAAAAAHAVAATWQLEQPAAPAPPAGVAPAPFPVPLGPIGDIDFTAPNRGVLITAGNGPVPAGLYAYDGVAWHQYSTVCGGEDGRIAWAGNDTIWTVSDQRAAQQGPVALQFDDRSLCRISGGRVVASYATPQGQANSYQQMSAAACAAPDDCWFAGGLLAAPPPYGAFHLHWDGRALTSVPSSAAPVTEDPAHAVLDLAAHQGSIFESVVLGDDDPENPNAPDADGSPSWLHLLSEDLNDPFLPLPMSVELGRTPRRGTIRPTDLDAFDLSSDGTTLWAIAGAKSGARGANVVAVQIQPSGEIAQLELTDAGGTVPPFGSQVTDVAAEPGTGAAWVAYRSPDGPSDRAEVARIEADGSVTRSEIVPAPGDPIGPKGTADKIACPAADDCWLTTSLGWLFHLTDGAPHARDADPAFSTLITTRPADDGIPFQPPIELPVDDSLINQRRAASRPDDDGPDDPPDGGSRRRRRSIAIVRGVRPIPIRGTTDVRVVFTLTRRARVTVIARRRKKVVARSRPTKMAKGRRSVRLHLNRHRWPTAIAVDAKPIVSSRGGSRRGAETAVATALVVQRPGRASGGR
jgi:hypothetical protein